MEGKTFGQHFKSLRKRTGLTLRKFSQLNGLDPGNISRLERGLLPPPAAREKLESWAKMLGIVEGSNDWYDFFDLAAVSSGHIPADVMKDPQLVAKLPMVFRTLRGDKVPTEQLDELAELIRKS